MVSVAMSLRLLTSQLTLYSARTRPVICSTYIHISNLCYAIRLLGHGLHQALPRSRSKPKCALRRPTPGSPPPPVMPPPRAAAAAARSNRT